MRLCKKPRASTVNPLPEQPPHTAVLSMKASSRQTPNCTSSTCEPATWRPSNE